MLQPNVSTTHIVMGLTPLFLWSIIFFLQPHKEERFFYVVYPLICANAAIFLDSLLVIGKTVLYQLEIPRPLVTWMEYAVHISILTIIALIGLLRINALHHFYFAPLDVYSKLFEEQEKFQSRSGDIRNVCVGREWYRYPSSYFLPDNMRLRFVQCDFNGILPTEFIGDSWLDGASRVPEGLNNINKQEMSFYVPLSECDYMVDSNYTISDAEGSVEQQYIMDTESWDIVSCSHLLDSDGSSLAARILKLPASIERIIPQDNTLYHRSWVSYCLLRSRAKAISNK